MQPTKSVTIPLLSALIGIGVGSAGTYAISARKHHREVMEDFASRDFMSADNDLKLLAMLERQDISAAKSQLNYDLAGLVYNAKAHATDPDNAGFWFRETLKKTTDLRKQPAFQVEEKRFAESVEGLKSAHTL
ncbi:hypothetical protein [Geothrix alkalitolerans]|uniref:hypothetical protein n=1 Tax=Geothrix alkalitolerans TaxID=2922724 RepID=UPI001FAFD245|nr:hypothetical protein [Geothrix alkalitolerans]